jgi:SNF2 family DNA or RNA helicase
MSAIDTFNQHFSLPDKLHGQPFNLHPLQIDAIENLVQYDNAGVFLDVGTGKTVVETVVALHRALTRELDVIVLVMPPLLVTQWQKWLTNVRHRNGDPLQVVAYQGTPTQRAALPLDKADVILTGIQILKRDYERFQQALRGRRYHVGVDEATMVANIGSDNHEKVYDLAAGWTQDMLTGTPINSPMNAYGLLKFTNPGCYRNFKHFENMHVEERDFFGNPVKFQNLDLLKENLAKNSYRILFEDMYPDVDTPLFVPMPYQLEPAHMKLYRRLAEEQLLALEDGGKIDATSANTLVHALGQIILNYGHFSGDPKNKSAALGMIENRLNDVQGKLVIFANYQMSVALITEHFAKRGAVAVNGAMTRAQQRANIERFIEDDKCELITINPKSAGYGLDGLQHVCHHMMFMEPVPQPATFTQCVARLKRTGQRRRVVVGLPTAEGTLQVRGFRNLLENDTIASKVIRNAVDLRDALYGN